MLAVAFREAFELDSRVARTMGTISRHPGRLSSEFAKNRRASYVTPFRLYLFSSLLCFFIITLMPGSPARDEVKHSSPENVSVNFDVEDGEFKEGLEHLQSFLDVRQQEMVQRVLDRTDAPLSQSIVAGIVTSVSADTHTNSFAVRFIGALIEIADSPADAFEKLVDNLPLMMFVLLPWFTFLLALFYYTNHMRLIHHLVFALHIHSFGFVLFAATFLIFLSTPQSADSQAFWNRFDEYLRRIVFFVFLVHSWMAFRTFYAQSIVKTTSKFLGVCFLYLMMLGPAFLVVVAFTIFQFT